MPFDFKNNNSSNSNNDGGFNSGFSGSISDPSQSTSSGFTGVPSYTPSSSGFSDAPKYQSGDSLGDGGLSPQPDYRPPIINNPVNTPKKPKVKGAGFDAPNLPWGIVAKVLAIVAVLAVLYVFRDAITEFLAQIIVWVIIIFILWIIVKLFFRRR